MTALLRKRAVRTILIVTGLVVALKAASALTGFGEWVETTPAAASAWRVFALLLFGALGLAMLFHMSPEKQARPSFYRLGGILFLVIAAIHAMILSGVFLDPVSE